MGIGFCTCKEYIVEKKNELEPKASVPYLEEYKHSSSTVTFGVMPSSGRHHKNETLNNFPFASLLQVKQPELNKFSQQLDSCKNIELNVKPVDIFNCKHRLSFDIAQTDSTHKDIENNIQAKKTSNETALYNIQSKKRNLFSMELNEKIESGTQASTNLYIDPISCIEYITINIKIDIKEALVSEKRKKMKKIRILNFIKEINLIDLDPDTIVSEGELVKYLQGQNTNFIQRWAQISRKELKYFKNRYHSTQWLAKPLASIPLHKIENVTRLDFNCIPHKSKKTVTQLNYFYFQISLSSGSARKNNYNHKVMNKALKEVKQISDSFIEEKQISNKIDPDEYKEETKIIFAVHSKQEIDKWITILNWYVEIYKIQTKTANASPVAPIEINT